MTSLPPTMSSGVTGGADRSRARRSSTAPFTVASTDSGVSGFSMKWNAPSRVASTASWSVARPLIITTGTSGRRSASCRSAVSPSVRGMARSRSTTSGSSVTARSTPAPPSSASATR